MNRPARERSSGSASVMSSPPKSIEPSVTSSDGVAHDRVGERRLAGAVRPHQRVDLALADLEVEALEDLLVLGVTCRSVIFRSAIGLLRLGLEVGRRRRRQAAAAGSGERGARRAARLELDRARSSVVPASAFVMPPWTRVHSSFVAQAWSPSVSCEQSTRPSLSGVEALHRRDRALEHLDDLEHLDLGGGPAEPVAAAGAALRDDQARPCQLRGEVLEVGERQRSRPRPASRAARARSSPGGRARPSAALRTRLSSRRSSR